ncbi:hypothetical protein GCM10010353_50820 [Streptomyces chryseus]|nr:hypothetical protein GCM10010353_50820 [Streptomyces chryseus]
MTEESRLLVERTRESVGHRVRRDRTTRPIIGGGIPKTLSDIGVRRGATAPGTSPRLLRAPEVTVARTALCPRLTGSITFTA